jgi:hypothetical protein
MSVNIESIDELRKRADVSYEEAKNALEKTNGNLLEALIILEKEGKSEKDSYKKSAKSWREYGIIKFIKRAIKKGNSYRVIVHKNEKVVIDVTLTATTIVTVVFPYAVGIVFIVTLISGYKLKIKSEKDDVEKVNKALENLSNFTEATKKKIL